MAGSMTQEEAENWVYVIDEWIDRSREPTDEELEALRAHFERIATTFPHRRLWG